MNKECEQQNAAKQGNIIEILPVLTILTCIKMKMGLLKYFVGRVHSILVVSNPHIWSSDDGNGPEI